MVPHPHRSHGQTDLSVASITMCSTALLGKQVLNRVICGRNSGMHVPQLWAHSVLWKWPNSSLRTGEKAHLGRDMLTYCYGLYQHRQQAN